MLLTANSREELPFSRGILSISGFPHRYKGNNFNTYVNSRISRHIRRFSKITLSLPKKKMENLQTKSRDYLNKETVTVRELSKLIGWLFSIAVAVFPTPLQYWSLQHQQVQGIIIQNFWEGIVNLSTQTKAQLLWWSQNLTLYNDKSLIISPPQFIITSDASKLSWGASYQGKSIGRPWSLEKKVLHMNVLELVAVKYIIITFSITEKDVISIHIQMDNMAALLLLLKMQATKNPQLVKKKKLCQRVPGKQAGNRHKLGIPVSLNWTLKYLRKYTWPDKPKLMQNVTPAFILYVLEAGPFW